MGTNAVRDKKIKGSVLEYWVNYARIWVEKYAPEKDRLYSSERFARTSIRFESGGKRLFEFTIQCIRRRKKTQKNCRRIILIFQKKKGISS